MDSAPENQSVGDDKSPVLKPDIQGLTQNVKKANEIPAFSASVQEPPDPLNSFSASFKYRSEEQNVLDCTQTVWFSFFFDGTGNNLNADVGTLKHSNIAKLYRAHMANDTTKGIYAIYIPGVGTYFSDVDDDGGSAIDLGTGAGGDERIDWAITQFDDYMLTHIKNLSKPSSKNNVINISVFGFSRGAALARAFTNRLIQERCKTVNSSYLLSSGKFSVRIRFMGLFDTVASSGLPMSVNNVSVPAAIRGIKDILRARVASKFYPGGASSIAVDPKSTPGGEAMPGADPAPGNCNGHSAYGADLLIPDLVEQVQHFIAGHEIRNSFPVDSIFSQNKSGGINAVYNPNFRETVYPGVHSDIGGSYRPGEGGRSGIPEEKLGLIPLRHMYELAIGSGVPLLPETGWNEYNKEDFKISPNLLSAFNNYISKLKNTNSLGDLFNSNMSLYYSWRFRTIKNKLNGNHSERERIASSEIEFASEKAQLKKNIDKLQRDVARAKRKMQQDRENLNTQGVYVQQNDLLLREQAKLDALPSVDILEKMIELYDEQLLSDAEAILKICRREGGESTPLSIPDFSRLRPHYKLLMTAYLNEFINESKTIEKGVLDFFDNFVHDSLAGFAKDATLPSDPRVVYVGANDKLQYAMIEDSSSPVDQKIFQDTRSVTT